MTPPLWDWQLGNITFWCRFGLFMQFTFFLTWNPFPSTRVEVWKYYFPCTSEHFIQFVRKNPFLEMDTHPYTLPHGVECDKHDFSVHIFTFHLMPCKTILFIMGPTAFTAIGVGIGKHDFSAQMFTF